MMEGKPEFGPKILYSPDRGAGGGRGQDRDPLLEANRAEDRAYFYVEPNFVSMLGDLKILSREKLVEREKVKEKLERDWGRLIDAELNELQDLLDYQLLRFKSPFPYDSRKPGQWFEGLRDGNRRARREDWEEPFKETTMAWLDRAASDTSWGEANFLLQEGLGTVLPNFYDGKKMMQWVNMPMRSDPVASFYELAFNPEPPGLKLTEKRKDILPEKTIEGINIKEGLRGKATRYQDENTFWRMAVASVHQIDYNEGGKPSIIEKLSPTEIEFIRRVFIDHDAEAEAARWKKLEETIRGEVPDRAGELLRKAKELMKDKGWVYYTYKEGNTEKGVWVPTSLLNWNAMGSIDEKKRRYLATMEVLLTEDVLKKVTQLEKTMPDGSPGFDEAGMSELVGIIEGKVTERLDEWFSYSRTLDGKLASVVSRFGIVMDWSHMSSAEMSWGWDYDVSFDPETKDIVVKRTKPMGGTTVATDSSTPAFWRESEMTNERKAWSKGMLPPMSEEYRKALREHPVDWKPNFYERLGRDPDLKAAWDALWADESGWKWDAKLKVLLQNMVWYWETPYSKTGEKLVLPIFLPPELASLNFLNTISFKGDGVAKSRVIKDEHGNYVIRSGEQTVWDQLRKRDKMSDLNWKRMGDQALYRWMITMGQAIRYIVTMLDPKSVVKDQYEAFFENPANLGELLKRADLGERDEQLPMTALTMSLVPMLVVLKSLPERGIFGEAGKEVDRRSDWAQELAKWITMFEYLPSEREGFSNYGKGMAKLTIFYAALVARIGQVAGKDEEAKGTENYGKIQEFFGKVGVTIKPRVVDLKPPPPER